MQELRTPHLPQTCVHGHEIGKVGAGRRGRLVVVSLRDGVVHMDQLTFQCWAQSRTMTVAHQTFKFLVIVPPQHRQKVGKGHLAMTKATLTLLQLILPQFRVSLEGCVRAKYTLATSSSTLALGLLRHTCFLPRYLTGTEIMPLLCHSQCLLRWSHRDGELPDSYSLTLHLPMTAHLPL